VLCNPVAGRGVAARVVTAVTARLRAVCPDLTLCTPSDAAGSRAAAERAVADGVDLLITVGGDGLIHHVLQACATTGTALAPIPAGTGNDFAAALGVPADPLAAADRLAAALAGPVPAVPAGVDLGRAVLPDGRPCWFATVLCTGFDARVADRAGRMRWPRGPRRYEVAVLAELAALRPRTLAVTVGEHRRAAAFSLVAVGNTASYGGGLRICPDARIDDGLLEVTEADAMSRRHLLRLLPKLRTGTHLADPAVHARRAAVVRIEPGTTDPGPAGPAATAWADGEPVGPLPVTISCERAALRVLPGVRPAV
jgi:diacylglycerol kinase (ATP)